MLKDALRHSPRLLAESDEPPAWLDGIAVDGRGDARRVAFPHVCSDACVTPHRDAFARTAPYAPPPSPRRRSALRPFWTVSATGIAIPFPEPDAMLIHPLKKIEKICVNDKTAHQVAARVAAKAEK